MSIFRCFTTPWQEFEAEIRSKSSKQEEVKEPTGFIPVTNPVSPNVPIPLPIVMEEAVKEKYYLHIFCLRQSYRLPVSKEIYDQADAGDKAKLRVKLGLNSQIKKAEVAEVIKKQS